MNCHISSGWYLFMFFWYIFVRYYKNLNIWMCNLRSDSILHLCNIHMYPSSSWSTTTCIVQHHRRSCYRMLSNHHPSVCPARHPLVNPTTTDTKNCSHSKAQNLWSQLGNHQNDQRWRIFPEYQSSWIRNVKPN